MRACAQARVQHGNFAPAAGFRGAEENNSTTAEPKAPPGRYIVVIVVIADQASTQCELDRDSGFGWGFGGGVARHETGEQDDERGAPVQRGAPRKPRQLGEPRPDSVAAQALNRTSRWAGDRGRRFCACGYSPVPCGSRRGEPWSPRGAAWERVGWRGTGMELSLSLI